MNDSSWPRKAILNDRPYSRMQRLKKLSTLLLAIALPSLLAAQEICNNGIDDDNDGLIDLNDPDCPCSTLIAPENLPSYIRNHSFEERLCCPYSFVSIISPPWLDCATGWHQATNATSDYFNMCGYAPVGFNLPPPDGDGAVGFFAFPGYFEYVGTCLTYPAPANPLLAGTTYTLSLWISTAIVNDYHTQTRAQGEYTAPFTDALPLAIFGYANACVPFPISTIDCIGYLPGWSELGRVEVQPAWDWTRVSITFTPTQDIHSILIGGACDTPASMGGGTVTNPNTGETYLGTPYFVVDDLLLTIAQDQVLQPVATSGSLCAADALAVGTPPPGASNYQWYVDGVAIPGQTGQNLNISANNLGGGVYAMASTFNGQCLMGGAYLPPPLLPVPYPSIEPAEGCAPLTVQFADTAGAGIIPLLWELGNGISSTDSAFSHIYTQPGTYDVALTVRNSAGCTADTLMVDAIIVHPGISGSMTASPNPVNADDPQVTLSGSGSGNITSWWWDLGDVPPDTSSNQVLNVNFPSVPGEYPVTLVVTSDNGCTDTVRSVITVIKPGIIEMPNVFSPNSDGYNDNFTPLDIQHQYVTGMLQIFNRWGQAIFTTRNLTQGWNGKDAPDGTYFYVVTPDQPGTEKLSGYVTLVR